MENMMNNNYTKYRLPILDCPCTTGVQKLIGIRDAATYKIRRFFFPNLVVGSMIILLLIGLQGFTSPSGDDLIKDISTAIGKMDSKKLADYFSSNIDLEINETNGSFSKTQAEIILRDFFKSTPATSFTINHQGESDDGSKFFIGTYKTVSKNYRVYGLLKKETDKLTLRQLQFDLE
jgi:hypothetical protein